MIKPAKKRGAKPAEEGAEPAVDNLVPLSGAPGGVEVLSVDESYANTVHLRLLELKRQYESTYFEMARLLYEVVAKRLYRAKSCGAHETFEEYVGHELSFGLRKAQQLANIWWWFGIQQGAEPKLLQGAQDVGWTKAALLVKVVDKDNAEKWFAIAKTANVKTLTEQTKAALEGAGKKRDTRVADIQTNPPKSWPQNQEVPADTPSGSAPAPDPDTPPLASPPGVSPPSVVEGSTVPEIKYTGRTFRLASEQNEIVGKALYWAAKVAVSDNPNNLITLICQHYLSFVSDEVTIIIGEWLARFERLTGLRVIAVNRENEVVYGHEYLRELPEEEQEAFNAGQAGDSDQGA